MAKIAMKSGDRPGAHPDRKDLNDMAATDQQTPEKNLRAEGSGQLIFSHNLCDETSRCQAPNLKNTNITRRRYSFGLRIILQEKPWQRPAGGGHTGHRHCAMVIAACYIS